MTGERRRAVLSEARRWIGTPYVHQASLIGVGADCLGLVRGIWRSLFGDEPEAAPSYAPDWSEVCSTERLWAAAARHFAELDVSDAEPGDLLLFRMRDGAPAKHLGVLSKDADGAQTVIHAYSGHGVVEAALGESWRRRIVAAFRFPERNA